MSLETPGGKNEKIRVVGEKRMEIKRGVRKSLLKIKRNWVAEAGKGNREKIDPVGNFQKLSLTKRREILERVVKGRLVLSDKQIFKLVEALSGERFEGSHYDKRAGVERYVTQLFNKIAGDARMKSLMKRHQKNFMRVASTWQMRICSGADCLKRLLVFVADYKLSVMGAAPKPRRVVRARPTVSMRPQKKVGKKEVKLTPERLVMKKNREKLLNMLNSKKGPKVNLFLDFAMPYGDFNHFKEDNIKKGMEKKWPSRVNLYLMFNRSFRKMDLQNYIDESSKPYLTISMSDVLKDMSSRLKSNDVKGKNMVFVLSEKEMRFFERSLKMVDSGFSPKSWVKVFVNAIRKIQSMKPNGIHMFCFGKRVPRRVKVLFDKVGIKSYLTAPK